MAKQGFRVLDSDMHIMEPPDLWERYIDPKFRDIAPRGTTSPTNVADLRTVFPTLQPAVGPDAIRSGHNYERNQALYADHAARGWTADCQIEAMDVEGIDVAVLFPSRALSVLTFQDMDPPFAAAIARAYNDWMAD
ncbi:MAG TPA: hypothetical protein VKU60_12055, partial [Chloroflexota bacterium]|nr:hypothetical protein [Chloroflexota bacterium]